MILQFSGFGETYFYWFSLQLNISSFTFCFGFYSLIFWYFIPYNTDFCLAAWLNLIVSNVNAWLVGVHWKRPCLQGPVFGHLNGGGILGAWGALRPSVPEIICLLAHRAIHQEQGKRGVSWQFGASIFKKQEDAMLQELDWKGAWSLRGICCYPNICFEGQKRSLYVLNCIGIGSTQWAEWSMTDTLGELF